MSSAAFAEPIVVKLLNGKSGKPCHKVRVYIVFGDPRNQHTLDLTTDREGEVRFEASEERTFQVRPIGEVPCDEQSVGASNRDYSVDDVLKKGTVTKNDCGHLAPEPIRGRLIYLVRPGTWLELFRN